MSDVPVDDFTNESLSGQASDSRPAESEAQSEPEEQVGADPDVAEAQKLIEERFGGDINKAMKSYAHMEREYSRRGQDNQELQENVRRLEQMIEERFPADDGLDDYVEVDEDEAYENPAAAAERAYNAGDRDGVRKAVAAWKEQDPFVASAWWTEKRIAEASQQFNSQLDTRISPHEQNAQAQVVGNAYNELQSKYPDFDDFFRSGGYEEALSSIPAELRNATLEVIQGGDKSAIASALEYVYTSTKGRAGGSSSQPATGNRDSGQGAAVLGQELGAPAGSQPAMSEVEQVHAQIKSQVMGDDSLPEEFAFVTAANELRASRNLQY